MKTNIDNTMSQREFKSNTREQAVIGFRIACDQKQNMTDAVSKKWVVTEVMPLVKFLSWESWVFFKDFKQPKRRKWMGQEPRFAYY